MSRRVAVDSFAELVRRPFSGGVNALYWRRTLAGDFAEVARLLAPREGVAVVERDALQALSAAGSIAAGVMLEDLQRLAALGCEPVLNCVTDYPRDERGLPIATHVMSFHADRAPVEVDTWLCTYSGKSSEGLDNDDAVRLIDAPEIRAELLRHFCGDEAALREEGFDLHYRAVAKPFSFGVGHLWRIAVAWPGALVPPCLHRAPETEPGDEPRLLLIA